MRHGSTVSSLPTPTGYTVAYTRRPPSSVQILYWLDTFLLRRLDVVVAGALPQSAFVGLDQSVRVTRLASCTCWAFTQAPKSNELYYGTMQRL